MGGQIVVVKVTVGILRRRLTDDDAAVNTVKFLETCVRVPEVSTSVTLPLISEINIFLSMLATIHHFRVFEIKKIRSKTNSVNLT